MTPGARIAAAIEVLEDVAARHRPIADTLKDWGLSHRFAGSKDRAAIGNIVYDTYRLRRSTAWIMDSDTPRSLALGVVARLWGEGATGLSALLAAPHAPSPLSDQETERLTSADLAEAPDVVRADVPDWLAPSLNESLGDNWVAELQAMAERPPLDVRVNTLRADRERVQRTLVKHRIMETKYSPYGLRSPPIERDGRLPNLQAEPGFQKGWFEIQDEGSQLAALAVGAQPGEQILDYCAGGGGKTLALSAMMRNKGQVHATDSDKHRLAPIFDRVRRAGTRNVQVTPAGADLGAFAGTMDRVLVDAPCSGSGTWRRHPDTKWKLTERSLADRCAKQAALLAAAAPFVKPGGLLFYVTCSILAGENSEQVDAFRTTMSTYQSLDGSEILKHAALPDAAKSQLSASGVVSTNGLILTPLRTDTDGFFVAAFRRGTGE